MLTAKVVMTLLLSQYVQSRVDRNVPTSMCLGWREDTVITFQQQAAGNPETPGDTEFTAVSAAFSTWEQALESCSSLRLVEGARSPSRVVADDGTNLVLFRQTDCDALVPACPSPTSCGNTRDCWEHANGALAITTAFYDSSGRISDVDIELNVPSFIFTTVDSPPCVAPNYDVGCVASDVQNTLTHEVGHLLGLAHSPADDSTMNARTVPTELRKRVLDADSKQFLCDVYPAGGKSRGCVVPHFSGALGKAAPGCSSVPGVMVALLGLLLRRRGTR